MSYQLPSRPTRPVVDAERAPAELDDALERRRAVSNVDWSVKRPFCEALAWETCLSDLHLLHLLLSLSGGAGPGCPVVGPGLSLFHSVAIFRFQLPASSLALFVSVQLSFRRSLNLRAFSFRTWRALLLLRAACGKTIPTSPTIFNACSTVSIRGPSGAGAPPCTWPRSLS